MERYQILMNSGFGLTISQMLVKLLGPPLDSQLTIESKGTGKGTSVSFLIANNFTRDSEFNITLPTPVRNRKQRNNSVPNISHFYGLILKIRSATESALLFNRSDFKTLSRIENENENLACEDKGSYRILIGS